MSSQKYVSILGLAFTPIGGHCKNTERCKQTILTATDLEVPLFANFIFLITQEIPSWFHLIQSDEVWYFHDGKPLKVHCIYQNGEYKEKHLVENVENGEVQQFEVPDGGKNLFKGEIVILAGIPTELRNRKA